FLITEAKMPQKLIPNHRTINSKQLLKKQIEFRKRPYSQLGKMRNSLKTNILVYMLMRLVRFVGFDFF
ncbi:hypothetical protein, partial [Bacteroides gallinaceum]|uniref:hypothetical protein n=1 Tax=Bacteroides gallinaceum TaxID=1462571 RepID=UPI001955FBB2